MLILQAFILKYYLFSYQDPDPECHLKCGEHGSCNYHNMCQCQPGYIGKYCETPVCFPQCINGGNCTAPSVCTCPEGYQGIKCEGGNHYLTTCNQLKITKQQFI